MQGTGFVELVGAGWPSSCTETEMRWVVSPRARGTTQVNRPLDGSTATPFGELGPTAYVRVWKELSGSEARRWTRNVPPAKSVWMGIGAKVGGRFSRVVTVLAIGAAGTGLRFPAASMAIA